VILLVLLVERFEAVLLGSFSRVITASPRAEIWSSVVVFETGNVDHWCRRHPTFTRRSESMSSAISSETGFADFGPRGPPQD
jgi:hypothetical protein